MDIEYELRAMDQARLTTDGIHFDSIEKQAWLNSVFPERLDELEVELFDTGVLKEEGASKEPKITTFVPPNLETRLGAVPAVTIYKPQSSSEPGHRTDVRESTSREERRPNRSSLMWSRPIPSPWHIYKDDLMKLNLQRVSFAADAMRMLKRARLSVSRLYSKLGVDWLIAAGINFSSITALRFADLEGLPSKNTMVPVNARPLQDVKLNHDEGNRDERPGRFLMRRAPVAKHVKMFRQVKTPPGHVKEQVYPKQVNQECDVQRYGGLKAIKKDETIFAAYDKAEMRKAKILIVANSDFVFTSKSLFWPDVTTLAAVDLDLMQSVSMAIGVQRQTEMNPITIKPGIDDDHRVIVAMSNDSWFRGMDIKEEGERRNNSKDTRAHLEEIVLSTKPEANQWPHLTPRVAALGTDASEQGPVMIRKIHAYLVKEVNLAENSEEKAAEFVSRVGQVTLETSWTEKVKGKEGFERTDSMLEGLGAGWTASFLAKV